MGLSAHHCYLDFHNFHHKNVLVHFLGNSTTTKISDWTFKRGRNCYNQEKQPSGKNPRNRPWYVTCDIPANNNIHYNVLFSESRTACFKLHRHLRGNVGDVAFPVQSCCLLLAQGGIAPGLFGDSSFKKSRKQPVTRSDRGASHSTSSIA